MTQTLSNAQTRDVEALLHPYTNAVALRETGPMIIERGEGVRVFDQAGRPYIEAMSGLWCAGLGFGNAELVEAARLQMEKLPYYHLFGGKSHEPAVELAEKIKALAPGRMARVFYQSSGSEANDTQVKLAWYYNNALGRPAKKKIISRTEGLPRGHHRRGLADRAGQQPPRLRPAGAPASATSRRRISGRAPRKARARTAFTARLAGELEATIETEGPETVAAFIAEPVMGAGGVIVPPEGYFAAMSAICRKYDILMISDEVITGFGRTGAWFGAETLDYPANSLSMAKQLTGGYLPLCAVAIDAGMAEVIEANSGRIGTFGHGYTYGGHPVGCAVGVKALEIYERLDICARVRALAPRFARASRPAGGASAGRRGAASGADGRDRAGAGEVAQGLRHARQGRAAAGAGADRARGDRPGDRRRAGLLPADDHHRGGDRRDVRPGRRRRSTRRSTGRGPRGISLDAAGGGAPAARFRIGRMNPLRGIGLKVLSVMIFTLMAVCIKASAPHVPVGAGGVLPLVLRDPGDPRLADARRGKLRQRAPTPATRSGTSGAGWSAPRRWGSASPRSGSCRCPRRRRSAMPRRSSPSSSRRCFSASRCASSGSRAVSSGWSAW